MKKCGFVLLVLAITVLFSGCGLKEKSNGANVLSEDEAVAVETVEDTVVEEIENLLSTEEPDKGDSSVFSDNKPQLFAENEGGKALSEEVKYSISNIKLDGDKAIFNVTVEAPDVYAVVSDIVDSGEVSDVDGILERVPEYLESGDYAKIKKTVECEAVKTENGWELTTNYELYNALSGNAMESYSAIEEEFFNNLMEEAENEE